MSTLHVNLLPQKRIGAIAAVRLARWWVLGSVIYCTVAFVLAGAYSLGVSRRGAGNDNSAVIAARLEAKRAEKQTLTGRVTDLRKRVDAARAVGHHPDWSVFLRHLALARPASLIMDRCELKRVETTTRTPAKDGKPETSTTSTRLVLVITGLAEQIGDVHAFVGQVEGAGVFDAVRVGETSVVPPTSPGQPTLTRYTIQCELSEPQEGVEQ
ncbi:MAG TPA: hypothetical protein VHN77_09875 [Phycisphaerales bacterium]|nr:hypothetical protein [Phycisphaerales bacterium]